MFNSRIDAARSAVAAACIGMACVVAAGGSPPATSASGVYGDPEAAAKYWQEQSLEDNCGLMAVADVVGEITGNAPTERQMIKLAEHTPSGANPGPIYAPRDDPSHTNGNGGIEMADEVVLLDHYGIKSTMTYDKHPEQTGLPALEQYLSNNRKIIAWVNSAIIWDTHDERAKADHFLVVTGIDTNKEIVHLNDPASNTPTSRSPSTLSRVPGTPARTRSSSPRQPAELATP
jgi:hypothetical protein